jgi:adenosyl cobinamide kinase/adenosyl cobinamide phosphate guanylyltransferase
MNSNFNPYGQKTHSADYGTYFNLFYYYVEKYKCQPNIYEYAVSIKKSTFKKIEDLGAKKFYFCELEKLVETRKTINEMEFCYEYEDALIFFHRKESLLSRIEYAHDEDEEVDFEPQKDLSTYRCRILYKNKETLSKLDSKIEIDTQNKKHSNVFLLCTIDGMLSLQRFDVKLPKKNVDLELNYGKSAAEKFNKIINNLKKNKNGLILFSGDPGTGKSTFIKYLTTKTTRKVIYLSSGAAEQLTNPDFLSFIMSHRNCILLLEDAEKVLRSRESADNDAISNILNITDGILGDCLNIMVIATFNIDRENIDSALVRKGRLLVEHHFDPLSAEDSNNLLKKIGSKRRTDIPMTLADIYNEEENFHSKKEKNKVGF